MVLCQALWGLSVIFFNLNWLCLLDGVARDKFFLRAALVGLVILVERVLWSSTRIGGHIWLALRRLVLSSWVGGRLHGISLRPLVLQGQFCAFRTAVVFLVVIFGVRVVVHDFGELVKLAFLADGLLSFAVVIVFPVLVGPIDTIHHILLSVGRQGELHLLLSLGVRIHALPRLVQSKR